MKLNWNFLGGGGEVKQNKKAFHVWSMDIFWNCNQQNINIIINTDTPEGILHSLMTMQEKQARII